MHCDLDLRDGREAEQAIFDDGPQLRVDCLIRPRCGEMDTGQKAGRHTGNLSAGCFRVQDEMCRTHQSRRDDVAAGSGDETVPECGEEVGFRKGWQGRWPCQRPVSWWVDMQACTWPAASMAQSPDLPEAAGTLWR